MKLEAKQRLTADSGTGVGGGCLLRARDTGRYLFLLRSQSSEDPGTWCCPGGGIEHHESLEEGIARELKEEIGYTKPLKLVFMHTLESDNFRFHNHFAWVPSEFTPALNSEHTDFVWSNKVPEPAHQGFLTSLRHYENTRCSIPG